MSASTAFLFADTFSFYALSSFALTHVISYRDFSK